MKDRILRSHIPPVFFMPMANITGSFSTVSRLKKNNPSRNIVVYLSSIALSWNLLAFSGVASVIADIVSTMPVPEYYMHDLSGIPYGYSLSAKGKDDLVLTDRTRIRLEYSCLE